MNGPKAYQGELEDLHEIRPGVQTSAFSMIRLGRLMILRQLELVGTAFDNLSKPFLPIARCLGRTFQILHVPINVLGQDRRGKVLPAVEDGIPCRYRIVGQEGIHQRRVGRCELGRSLFDDRLHFQERCFLLGLYLLDVRENSRPAVVGEVGD